MSRLMIKLWLINQPPQRSAPEIRGWLISHHQTPTLFKSYSNSKYSLTQGCNKILPDS